MIMHSYYTVKSFIEMCHLDVEEISVCKEKKIKTKAFYIHIVFYYLSGTKGVHTADRIGFIEQP